ncbi:MAG TPA: twin-arginine translocation signal domain-containing protein [Phycisphaerae bacterium]|nr:twin-arginine translocation signal domain-containing protein [Phycisphaerae bacterium]
MHTELTRRGFIKQVAIGASVAAVPTVARGYPANERIRLGWIGIGNRGEQLLTEVTTQFVREACTVAVCDLLADRVAKGLQLAALDRPKGYTDMRTMIEHERLDAVIVATPRRRMPRFQSRSCRRASTVSRRPRLRRPSRRSMRSAA